MARLEGLKAVLDFLQGLQPKIAVQITKKVLSLNLDPRPVDSYEKSSRTSQEPENDLAKPD